MSCGCRNLRRRHIAQPGSRHLLRARCSAAGKGAVPSFKESGKLRCCGRRLFGDVKKFLPMLWLRYVRVSIGSCIRFGALSLYIIYQARPFSFKLRCFFIAAKAASVNRRGAFLAIDPANSPTVLLTKP